MAPGAPSNPPPNGIWEYQAGAQQWGEPAMIGDQIQRIHIGSAINAGSYYLGGAITPKSDAAFNALPGATPYMVQGLLIFNETSRKIQNVSTTGLSQYGTMAGGSFEIFEAVGPAGVLIAFGGFSNAPGEPMSLTDSALVDSRLHLPLSNISVYDLHKQRWYQQAATGDVPPWRYFGCSVAVSALDRSSHSIYVFGGWSNSMGGSDGNVYVLSIPAFRWIRVNEDSDLRFRHSCGLIGNQTMLVVGGIQPNDETVQPLDITGCDNSSSMFAQGLGMFSLNNHTWATNYDPSEGSAAYQVHSSISAIIGGNGNGGATVRDPDGGFSHKALGILFHGTDSGDGSSGAKHKFSTGALVGIISGGVVLCALVFVLGICLFRGCYPRQRSTTPRISNPILQVGSNPMPAELSSRHPGFHELESPQKPIIPPDPVYEIDSILKESNSEVVIRQKR